MPCWLRPRFCSWQVQNADALLSARTRTTGTRCSCATPTARPGSATSCSPRRKGCTSAAVRRCSLLVLLTMLMLTLVLTLVVTLTMRYSLLAARDHGVAQREARAGQGDGGADRRRQRRRPRHVHGECCRPLPPAAAAAAATAAADSCSSAHRRVRRPHPRRGAGRQGARNARLGFLA